MRHGNSASVSLLVRYRGPIKAPIAKGQQVAFLQVSVAGQQPHEVPLVAAEAVPRANALQRLRNGLVGLFT
jgi:D-alanyl-D-alanine carboxypeptidase (penicillin-binding protein 5/6)